MFEVLIFRNKNEHELTYSIVGFDLEYLLITLIHRCIARFFL